MTFRNSKICVGREPIKCPLELLFSTAIEGIDNYFEKRQEEFPSYLDKVNHLSQVMGVTDIRSSDGMGFEDIYRCLRDSFLGRNWLR